MTAPFIISDEAGRQHALDRIAHLDLDQKKWELTVKRHRKRRSLSQNRMYWAWVTEVADAVSDYTGYEKDEVHEFFKQNFIPGRRVAIAGMEAVHRTTTKLNTKEMSEYCERIHHWASMEVGLNLPLPPERGYDSDGRPLEPEQAKQANGEADDWLALVMDIEAAIELADNRDRLEEVTAIYQDELDAMEKNAPVNYTRVMEAMERQGQELEKPAVDELHPEPAP